MEYFIIGVGAIAIAIGAYYIWKHRKQTAAIHGADDKTVLPAIRFEQLPAEAIVDEKKLMEITDSKVLARMNHLVPQLFQAENAMGTAVQAAQEGAQVFYQAIIPAGTQLTKSKAMEGAVRGMYHGPDGIQGHANFVAVQQNTNVAANVAANATASAMNVASLVVGQYYMTQINAELDEISAGIDKISDFQDNEYKSKVFALVAQVQKVAKFQADILENEELRRSEIDNLNRWEQECIELLGQANLTIVGFTKKTPPDYEAYEKELTGVQNWFVYQKTLLEVMQKIAELRHVLHLGTVSKEQCGVLLLTYSNQVQNALEQLSEWHKEQVWKLGINVDEKNRKRVGWDKVIHFIPGLFDEENNYRSVSETTVKKIVAQSSGYGISEKDEADLFLEDVRIIAKEGKIYYLPQEVSDEKKA